MVFTLLVLMCFLIHSCAFLLDTNTQTLMTDNHYDYLLKLFMDERNARLQLQQYVVNQQQQITTLAGLHSRTDNVVNTTMSQINATVDNVRKCEDLEKKMNRLQDELNTSKNRTSELEKEVENLRQSKMHQISDQIEFGNYYL